MLLFMTWRRLDMTPRYQLPGVRVDACWKCALRTCLMGVDWGTLRRGWGSYLRLDIWGEGWWDRRRLAPPPALQGVSMTVD